MSTPVEKIKERLGVVDVIESYIKLDRAGTNFKGKCPFHNEKTPSFFVSPDRNSYYCFGCGAKGDIFSFVQAFEGLDFMGAMKLLAQRAGVPLTFEKPEVKSERERYYAIMEAAATYYEELLTKNIEAQDYLKNRGLVDETIKEFRLGYAPDDWRVMYTYLKEKKFSDNDIEKVGLTKKTDKGYYDRFRGRIMFPIQDGSGRVIAFTGRILKSDDNVAKYMNSPETPLFNKAHVLYGIDKAKLDIRKRNFSILVEGQMDLIMSHQAGFKNTVASSGTALTDSLNDRENVVNNLGVVKRISNNIIMVYDSDKAGIAAAERSAQIALSLGMDVKIGSVPQGKDPAELILNNKELWKDVLKGAKHIIEFTLTHQIKDQTDPRKLAKGINERVLPLIAQLNSHMEKAHFVSMVHDRTGIPEDAIWSDLRKVEKNIHSQRPNVVNKAVPVEIQSIHRKDAILKKVLGIIFWQEKVETSTIKAGEYKDTIKRILGEREYQAVIEVNENAKGELIFEAEVVYGKSTTLSSEIDEMILQIEEDHLRDEFTKTMHELTVAERAKDETRAMELLSRCQVLTKSIAEISKRGVKK